MTETVSTAIEKANTGPSAIIEAHRDDFATVLPSHIKPDTWVRVAVGALRKNHDLLAAAKKDPYSLLHTLLDAARLGLEPGTEQYYLVPFKGKVTGIRGYQGEIELMYRAGAISSVIVEVVRQHDKFEFRPGRDERPVHEIDWDAEDRGPLRLAYSYAVMKDGSTSKVVVLNKHHIETAKKSSQSAKSPTSPWTLHEEAMWLKTAAHRLAKWVPTSAEYIREQLRAVRDVENESRPAPTFEPLPEPAPELGSGQVDEGTGEVLEAELVDTDDSGGDES